ncbi:MAG: hypothetical protein HXX14_10945 [Bacteroidetes bacterium]|nr:hypothetical protein [Bacteroidota bacterium]
MTPPKSYKKWHNLIKAMTEHYGKNEIKK